MPIILALAPLIVSLGGFFLNMFISDKQAVADKKAALQKWFDDHKNDGRQSVDEHTSYQNQIDELNRPSSTDKKGP